MDRDPSLLPKIQAEIERALIESFGEHPMVSPLQAWVFEAIRGL